HLKTTPCTPLVANPNFNSVTCDGFTVTLTQNTPGNPDTYFWDFGDPASGPLNYSSLPNPTHTFTDTGVFNIKLVVSIAGLCSDSITKPLGVYPNFFPGFINSAPMCRNVPIQFTDTTYFQYGNVTAWRWDFGDGSTLADTSHLQNPIYTYPGPGTYNVELTVTNDKGCVNTYTKSITINDNPVLNLLTADSIYCGLDSLQ
ncbi:MAG: PKD domain-containing protein, partial [Chitinophagaceae bacterium]|nr:PKD domain-containing protein [Chitinophagaceae bacterium]